jgi:hypothetical protein
MHLSKPDLFQMNNKWLKKLPAEQLLEVSKRLLHGAKELQEQLNQNPDNSSRPPTSQAPWEKTACAAALSAEAAEAPSQAYTAWDEVDMASPEGLIGLTFRVTRHTLLEVSCSCGHVSRAQPWRAPANGQSKKVEFGEWRLVGPRLTGLLISDGYGVYRAGENRLRCWPHLPLSNNAAEQALLHWVISRYISHGTGSEEGSRAFAFLASVIETCRRRGASAWRYLGTVIGAARKGLQLPTIPAIPAAV